MGLSVVEVDCGWIELEEGSAGRGVSFVVECMGLEHAVGRGGTL